MNRYTVDINRDHPELNARLTRWMQARDPALLQITQGTYAALLHELHGMDAYAAARKLEAIGWPADTELVAILAHVGGDTWDQQAARSLREIFGLDG